MHLRIQNCTLHFGQRERERVMQLFMWGLKVMCVGGGEGDEKGMILLHTIDFIKAYLSYS